MAYEQTGRGVLKAMAFVQISSNDPTARGFGLRGIAGIAAGSVRLVLEDAIAEDECFIEVTVNGSDARMVVAEWYAGEPACTIALRSFSDGGSAAQPVSCWVSVYQLTGGGEVPAVPAPD